MKLCALILAHQKPVTLGRLVRRLQRAGIAAYVHIYGSIEFGVGRRRED
jgi:hypothetical protein